MIVRLQIAFSAKWSVALVKSLFLNKHEVKYYPPSERRILGMLTAKLKMEDVRAVVRGQLVRYIRQTTKRYLL